MTGEKDTQENCLNSNRRDDTREITRLLTKKIALGVMTSYLHELRLSFRPSLRWGTKRENNNRGINHEENTDGNYRFNIK